MAKLRGAYCNFLFYKGAKKVYKLSSLYSCSSNAGKASSILKRRHQTEAYWILHGPVALIPRESDHGTDNIQHIVRDQEQFWALLWSETFPVPWWESNTTTVQFQIQSLHTTGRTQENKKTAIIFLNLWYKTIFKIKNEYKASRRFCVVLRL